MLVFVSLYIVLYDERCKLRCVILFFPQHETILYSIARDDELKNIIPIPLGICEIEIANCHFSTALVVLFVMYIVIIIQSIFNKTYS